MRKFYFILLNIISDGCCDTILQNAFVRLVKRILPLILALWHYADIILDVNQSVTYYDMAFDVNGTYTTWALQYQNVTNSLYPEKVSPWYFYTGIIAWIGPSFLLSLCYLIWYQHKSCQNCSKSCDVCSAIAYTILLLPVGTLICFLVIYLFLPMNLLYNAIRAVIEGDDFDNEKWYTCFHDTQTLTWALKFMKFLEIAGEAMPQLIINIVFITNNFPYLNENDTYFGIPVPVSIISAVFSIGSLVIGFKDGFTLLKNPFNK